MQSINANKRMNASENARFGDFLRSRLDESQAGQSRSFLREMALLVLRDFAFGMDINLVLAEVHPPSSEGGVPPVVPVVQQRRREAGEMALVEQE